VSYRLYDFSLRTNADWPELRPDGDGSALTITWAPARSPHAQEQWFHHWYLPDGSIWASAGRIDASNYLVRFHDMADVVVGGGGLSLLVRPHPDVPPATVRHLVLDQAAPLALAHAGFLLLHGSAVVAGGRLAIFLGRAGAGKSTLAAAFAADGHAVFADDAVLVRRGTLAVAPYPGLRLWPDTLPVLGRQAGGSEVADYTEKRRFDLESGVPFDSGRTEIARMYVVDRATERSVVPPRVRSLRARDACVAILRHAYRLDVADRAVNAAQLSAAAALAGAVPVRLLSYPGRHDALGDVRAAVLADLSRDA
jgi:hypothetical protein